MPTLSETYKPLQKRYLNRIKKLEEENKELKKEISKLLIGVKNE